MKRRMAGYAAAVMITPVLFLALFASAALGAEAGVQGVKDHEKITNGGLLYDKWYAVLNVEVSGTHASYTAEGKKTGSSTWRCKECHGWDYKGRDGAYATGSHFSGIKGIRDAAGKSPADITAILKNEAHGFGAMISDEAYESLAYFVAYGQVDMGEYIDSSTKAASGDAARGARIYASTCVKCHGADGRAINFDSPEKPEFLGTVAKKNPWETLHKIRFGQPSSEMLNLFFLDIKDQVDVLSYCQTLPVE